MPNNIMEKWREWRNVNEEMDQAQSAIGVTGFSVNPNICITYLVVIGNLHSTTTPVVCKHFSFGKTCDCSDCPTHAANARYMSLQAQCNNARREFFKSLVPGCSK